MWNDHVASGIQVDYGDDLDLASIYKFMSAAQLEEIYNLAAQSRAALSRSKESTNSFAAFKS